MLLDLIKPTDDNGRRVLDPRPERHGWPGEHLLQERFGTTARATASYTNQVLTYLNDLMQEFVARMDMVVIAMSSADGQCDASFRAGEPGFVRVLGPNTLVCPEYRGNGVMSSLGNMTENPHVAMMFIDFFRDRIGLHVNGSVRIVGSEGLLALPDVSDELRAELECETDRKAEHWVVVDVEEAFVHCSKHIPLLRKLDLREANAWGADRTPAKAGDHFRVAANRRAALKAVA